MSASTVQDGVLTVLRKMSHFDTSNSSREDQRILKKGKLVNAVINHGGYRQKHTAAPSLWTTTWIVNVDLWFRNKGEISFYNSDIATVLQDVLDQLVAYPTLDGVAGVNRVQPLDASDAIRWTGEIKNYWVVRVPVEIDETRTVAAVA